MAEGAGLAGKLAAARSRGGDMFGDSLRRNFRPFAPNAELYSSLSNAVVVVIPGGILLAAVLLLRLPIPLAAVPFLILLAAAWYGAVYPQRFIFTLDGKCMFLRRGVFIHAYTLLPYGNIQDIHVVQSIPDRLFGVWTVIIFTATTSGRGSETVPWLRKDDAEQLKAELFSRMREARDVTD